MKELKYIWQACFTIFALFVSYSIVEFIFKMEENSAPSIQPGAYQITKKYQSNGIDGKALFLEKCASCHHPIKDGTGPALFGAAERAPNKKILYEWIRNSQKVLEAGYPYYKSVYIKYGKTTMPLFTNLTNEEIEAILLYASPYKKDIEPITTVINNF
jgi:mono/diheme cytochrome c family protein